MDSFEANFERIARSLEELDKLSQKSYPYDDYLGQLLQRHGSSEPLATRKSPLRHNAPLSASSPGRTMPTGITHNSSFPSPIPLRETASELSHVEAVHQNEDGSASQITDPHFSEDGQLLAREHGIADRPHRNATARASSFEDVFQTNTTNRNTESLGKDHRGQRTVPEGSSIPHTANDDSRRLDPLVCEPDRARLYRLLESMQDTIERQEILITRLQRENRQLQRDLDRYVPSHNSHESVTYTATDRYASPHDLLRRNEEVSITSSRNPFSPGTKFVAELSQLMPLEPGLHAPLSIILDKHWERLEEIRGRRGWSPSTKFER